MATWAEFASGDAEVSGSLGPQGGAEGWRPHDGRAASLAAAGERLLAAAPAVIALLATVAPSGRPRVHPFMPRIVDGRLWAFVGTHSPKAGDLLRRAFTIHSALADEDEEFWVSGHARRVDEEARIEQLAALMEWAKPGQEWLFEFDLELAGWTRWIDFGTPRHRPQHYRWRTTEAR